MIRELFCFLWVLTILFVDVVFVLFLHSNTCWCERLPLTSDRCYFSREFIVFLLDGGWDLRRGSSVRVSLFLIYVESKCTIASFVHKII